MKHKNIFHFLLLFFCILNLKFVKGQDSVLLPDRNFHRNQNKFEYIIAPFIIIRNGDTINNVKYNWINFENLDDCKEINQIVYFNRRLYFKRSDIDLFINNKNLLCFIIVENNKQQYYEVPFPDQVFSRFIFKDRPLVLHLYDMNKYENRSIRRRLHAKLLDRKLPKKLIKKIEYDFEFENLINIIQMPYVPKRLRDEFPGERYFN